jgi:DNA polymerase III delta subunit
LGHRHAAAALTALRDQLRDGKEPLELVGLVAWQLNRWLAVKRLETVGYNQERIASATSFQPWQVQRIHAEIAGRPLNALQRLLQRCWQLDTDAKSGRALPELAIEQLVLELCL